MDSLWLGLLTLATDDVTMVELAIGRKPRKFLSIFSASLSSSGRAKKRLAASRTPWTLSSGTLCPAT